MQWNSSYQESVHSFANNINTREGGSHLSGLPLGADTDAQQVRARPRPAQGERGQPLRRGRARGPDRRGLGQARRPSVRGSDQDQARQPRHGRASSRRSSTTAYPSSSRRTRRGARGDQQGRAGAARPRGGAQGARPDAPQVGARELDAARQARRLLGQGPGARRAVRGRGRLRRRLGQAGPRPQHAGRAAAPRQDPQRREVAHRQGAAERRDPGADHRDRDRRARRVQHRERALPQGDPDDGRRRRRRPHPHARPDAAVQGDERADRGGLRLHRQAAALQAQAGLARALHREGLRTRRDPAHRQVGEDQRSSTATASSSS